MVSINRHGSGVQLQPKDCFSLRLFVHICDSIFQPRFGLENLISLTHRSAFLGFKVHFLIGLQSKNLCPSTSTHLAPTVSF